MENRATDISFVVENKLCTGCGTCAGICPEDAISLSKNDNLGIYEFSVDPQKCTACRLCVKVCSGYVVDLEDTSIFSDKNKYDYFLGSYVELYIGNSLDENIWENSSSGGLVTQLLVSLLEEKEIDGAIVTRTNLQKPLEPEVIIAKTKEEIISASKSKYCPVPLNCIIKEIIKNEGKYALAGLPCHIEGIKKAQKEFPILKERILYLFGLFCSRTPSFSATEFLLYKLGIPKSEIKNIAYRGGGHPGKLQITKKDGIKVDVKHRSRLYWGHNFYNFFWPSRCWICPDKTAELADISFADNWNTMSKWDHPKATSLIICRSNKANLLVKKLESQKKIELYKIGEESVVKSQDLINKKKIGARLYLFEKIGKSIPRYKQEILDYSFIRLLFTIPDFLRVLFTEKKRNYLIMDLVFTIDWILCSIYKIIKMLVFVISHPKLVVKYIKRGYFKQRYG